MNLFCDRHYFLSRRDWTRTAQDRKYQSAASQGRGHRRSVCFRNARVCHPANRASLGHPVQGCFCKATSRMCWVPRRWFGSHHSGSRARAGKRTLRRLRPLCEKHLQREPDRGVPAQVGEEDPGGPGGSQTRTRPHWGWSRL